MNREENRGASLALDALDRALLMLLQEELPLVPRPYQMLAEQFGCTEDEVVARVQDLKERKILRRLGAVLRHQQAGYAVNVLTAWNADPKEGESREEALDRVGMALAACSCVSHCYARVCPAGWDWPVFAMVHAASKEEMEACMNRMMQAVGSTDVRMMETEKEWKKTSMKYF